MSALKSVVDKQLEDMLSHDDNGSAWQDEKAKGLDASWGGVGKGGRGVARQTHQPKDINLQSVDLTYTGRPILERASLKFINGDRCYGLVGKNGVGKTSLLRAIASAAIPGFPLHVRTLLISQEVLPFDGTALSYIASLDGRVSSLEAALEAAVDPLEIERLCSALADLDSASSQDGDAAGASRHVLDALAAFGAQHLAERDFKSLSGGERRKVALAAAKLSKPDVLLLDEPSSHLDFVSINALRDFILSVRSETTVVVVTHDRELLDAVATDIVRFESDRTLSYYKGNYNDYLGIARRAECFEVRRAVALDRQRKQLTGSIETMRKQSLKEGAAGRKGRMRQVASRQKKLDRTGVEKDKNGHHWSAQTNNCGIRIGSINGLEASVRKKMSNAQLIARPDVSLHPIPDKEVHFKFRRTPAFEFYEPLIKVMEVSWSFPGSPVALFGNVDFSIRQRSRTVLLGPNGVGKTFLLKLMAGDMQPSLGRIAHAHNLTIAYFDQFAADALIEQCGEKETPISKLATLFPDKDQQELRTELHNFGIGAEKSGLSLKMMSGGERCRVALAAMMLKNPHVLICDEVSNHLDLESVSALGIGLKEWDGAVILASHDASLIRLVLEGGVGEESKAIYNFHEVDQKVRDLGLNFKSVVGRVEEGFDAYHESLDLAGGGGGGGGEDEGEEEEEED